MAEKKRIARVQMPDGRIARFEVPANATPEQIQQQAARVRAQAPRAKPRQQGTGIKWIDGALDKTNEFLLGLAQGGYNAGALLTDPIVAAVYGEKGLQADRKRRQGFFEEVSRNVSTKRRPGARTIGQIASTIPYGSAKVVQAPGVIANTVNRLATGAIGGAAVRDSDQGALAPAATGAAVNAVLPPVISGLSKTKPVKAVIGKARNVVAPVVNALDDAADDVRTYVQPRIGLPEYRAPAALPPPPISVGPAALGDDAVARLERFRRVGVENPTTGMVTRDPRAWQYERNSSKLAGYGDEMMNHLKGIEDQLADAGRGIVGQSPGREGAGEGLHRAMADKSQALQDEVGRLYTGVRETVGDVPVGNLTRFRDFLESPDIADDVSLDGVREAIGRRMARFGDDPITVTQAEDFRKFVSRLNVPGATPGEAARARRLIVEALDDDVAASVPGDAFAGPRAAARARFEEFNQTFPGRVADNAIAPEQLVKRINQAGTRNSDIRDLRQSLLTGTRQQRQQGRAALNNLRAQTIGDLINPSISPDNAVNGSQLFRDFTNNQERLGTILTPGQMRTIGDYVAASRDATATVPHAAVNHANSGTLLAGMFGDVAPGGGGNLLRRLAGQLTGATVGGIPGVVLSEGLEAAGGAVAGGRAAQLARNQFNLATNVDEAASALAAARNEALSDELRAVALQRWKDLLNNGRFVGAASVAPFSGDRARVTPDTGF
jgi:hypothetical protein